jgi:hypothetical protein
VSKENEAHADGTGGNEFNDCMWDVAVSLDANLKRAERGAKIIWFPGAQQAFASRFT